MIAWRLPGLHSLHWKVFVFHLAVLVLPVAFLSWKLRQSLESTHLQAVEEGMIDTAAMAGDVYTRFLVETGGEPAALADRFQRYFVDFESYRSAKSRLFGFSSDEADTRLVFYDAAGHVLYDTLDLDSRASPPRSPYGGESSGRDEPYFSRSSSGKKSRVGRDESRNLEVRLALSGRYGSRWQLDRRAGRVYIYSTVPVWNGPHIAGAVSVVKPTTRLVHFIVRTLKEILWPALGAIGVAMMLAYALSAYLTRIVGSLAVRAERIASGESGVRLETWTRSELGTLARAVERMRRKLEGKAYIEETVTNLSHELKTPLSAIRGAAELLEDGAVHDPVACARFLRNIQQEAARLDGIVDGLLQLARLEAAPATDPLAVPPLDLAEAARRLAADTYQERAERLKVRFSWSVPDDPVPCRITETHFRQAMGNLLDNALHFTPAGRTVTLTLTCEGGPDGNDGSRRAVLSVDDEGHGIEPAILPKVFERFFTTGDPRTGTRGTGLGLALVRSVVQAARGTVEADSELGKGSRFVVRLPLAE